MAVGRIQLAEREAVGRFDRSDTLVSLSRPRKSSHFPTWSKINCDVKLVVESLLGQINVDDYYVGHFKCI